MARPAISGGPMSGKKKLNAEEMLAKLAAIRAQIPHLDTPRPVREKRPERMSPSGAEDMADFETESVAEALESMADELHAAIEAAQAKAMAQALDVYYAAEELARDPAHADLIPHVEAMRAAYEHDFGKPIPPREKK
jgi:hypothetical protein